MQEDIRAYFSGGPSYYIHSMFPFPLHASRNFNGITEYHIPATSTQDEVNTLEVKGGYENMQAGENVVPAPVWAKNVANDLLLEFSNSVVGQEGGAGPAIWVSESPVPTEEEKQRYRARQVAYFDFLIREADDNHTKGQQFMIGDYHRSAAKWLGIKDRAWITQINQTVIKQCTDCFADIDSRARKCRFCGATQPGPEPEVQKQQKSRQ